MPARRNAGSSLSPLMWIAIAAAAALVMFLTFACDEARLAGIIASILWIPLIYGIFRTIRGGNVLAVGIAFPIAQLTLIITLLLTCPGSGGRSALAVGLVAFLIFGLIFGVSVGTFSNWREREE